MPTYTAHDPSSGRTLTLRGDSPPTEAELNDIFAKAAPKPAAPPPAAPNPWIDAARAIPGGLAKGVSATLGLGGDARGLVVGGVRSALGDTAANVTDVGLRATPFLGLGGPSTKQLDSILTAPTGGYYQTQTTGGRYAETIASLALASLGGEASIPARIARVAVPAVASQAVGDIAGSIDPSLEPYGRVVGAVAGGGALAGGRPVIRTLNKAFGGRLLDPSQEAARRLGEALSRDGGVAPAVQRVQDSAASGASPLSLIDVGGLNVRRLVRSAALPEGPAQNIATDYADRVAGALQENAVNRARQLTPGLNASADEYAAWAEKAQADNAKANYGGPNGPYAQPAQVTPQMVSALQGPEGRGAIGRAYAAARANRDSQAMAELSDLRDVAANGGATPDPLTGRKRSLADALSELSSGSLDRVRIAMRDQGRDLSRRGANDIARGYFGRVNDIDTALDQTPSLQGARAAYRGDQAVIDAVPVGRAALNTPADEYAAEIARLSGAKPAARVAAGVGYRQAITDAIERRAEGQTGVLNTIATSPQNTQNLATTFGPEGARFQQALRNEIDRLKNARYILPTSNSQTASNMLDVLGRLVHVPSSGMGWVAKVISHLQNGASLTEAERVELVRLGTSEADLTALARYAKSRGHQNVVIPGAVAAGQNSPTP